MTDQELYNKVKEHLLQQGEKSMNDLGQCSYRGENGKMCAIGCLIPEARYEQCLEGCGASHYKVQIAADLSDDQTTLAKTLQIIHDDIEVPMWEEELRKVALEYGLVP